MATKNEGAKKLKLCRKFLVRNLNRLANCVFVKRRNSFVFRWVIKLKRGGAGVFTDFPVHERFLYYA